MCLHAFQQNAAQGIMNYEFFNYHVANYELQIQQAVDHPGMHSSFPRADQGVYKFSKHSTTKVCTAVSHEQIKAITTSFHHVSDHFSTHQVSILVCI